MPVLEKFSSAFQIPLNLLLQSSVLQSFRISNRFSVIKTACSSSVKHSSAHDH